MNRVLVPVDFSANSANTLKYAHQLAIDKGMQLSLLYCFPNEEYSRKYDFSDIDYAEGIRDMLQAFYQEHIIDQKGSPDFIALKGSVVENIIQISISYKLILLGYKNFSTSINRWFGSRSIAIASLAYCPVIMVPPSTVYAPWNNIWHIKRKNNESRIIEMGLKDLTINPSVIQAKLLEQSTFTSLIWKSMVAYIKKPKESLRKVIIEAAPSEAINLIMLVSHQKESFQNFVHNEAIQILFEFGIPVMIFQAKSRDVD